MANDTPERDSTLRVGYSTHGTNEPFWTVGRMESFSSETMLQGKITEMLSSHEECRVLGLFRASGGSTQDYRGFLARIM